MRNLYDDRHTVEMVQVCLLFMISHAPWPSSKRAFKSESDFVSSQEFTTVPVAVPVVVTVTSSWNKLSPSSKNNCKVEMIGGPRLHLIRLEIDHGSWYLSFIDDSLVTNGARLSKSDSSAEILSHSATWRPRIDK